MARTAAPAVKRETARPPSGLLKDRAYQEIKTLIQTGEFPPGAFLSERQLADRLGMSKTPVRAALEHLDAQGLVSVSPQQGIVVRDLSLRETVDLFDLRTAIEPFVARRLCGRLTPAQASRIRENLAGQRAAVRAGDSVACATLDLEFHLLLCELAGNEEILGLMRRAFDKLYRSILRISGSSRTRLADSCREHAGIAKAIFDGDPDASARRMEEHLAFGRQTLLTG